MPRRDVETTDAAQPQDAPIWNEPVEAPPAEAPAAAKRATSRRIVKLPIPASKDEGRTMWLVENGQKRAITLSGAASALKLPVELVSAEDLAAWPDGEPYSG